MSIDDLPAVNATLNAISTILLTIGFVQIKRGNQKTHRNCMVAALVTSTLFLICYVIYHKYEGHTRFTDPEWFRPIYLFILATHVPLAALQVPLILITFTQAVRGQFETHKRFARWTFPIWMYVSVTGVVIYFLLYHIFPQAR